ncbi:SHOCT domain-containing protein [Lacticaseibacillus absianus]|uniref:SHOCT domain-containing protein n=1 Tax=Lacticaseibacillus absianus TaxID=2729623 RepID=UPI0015CAE23D|nr:SHOCT domain-containing protein [Lacticaseibacillus absianus]
MKNTSKSGGCLLALIALFAFAVLITYWYVFLGLALLGGAIWYYYHRQKLAAAAAAAAQAAQQAADQQQQAATAAKIDRIRAFKALLDEGAITQAEFDAQKAKLLEQDDPLDY